SNNPLSGSLEFLKNSTRLSELDISNTNIDDGLELLPENLKKITCKDDNKKKRRKILEQLKDYCLDTTKGIYNLEKWREDNRKSIEDARKKMNDMQKLNDTQLVGKAIEELEKLERINSQLLEFQLKRVSKLQNELEEKKNDLELLKTSLERTEKERDELKKGIIVLAEEFKRKKEEILKKEKIIIETKLELKKEEIIKL